MNKIAHGVLRTQGKFWKGIYIWNEELKQAITTEKVILMLDKFKKNSCL